MISEKIRQQLEEALKGKRQIEVLTLRLLLAEIHNKEMEKQAELSPEEIAGVVRKEIKKREEAIEAYGRGNRDDLVRKEKEELEILRKYLPQGMTPQVLEKIIKETMEEIGQKDFGKVMGAVMGKVKGRVEGAKVAEMVKSLLVD